MAGNAEEIAIVVDLKCVCMGFPRRQSPQGKETDLKIQPR
jgi:hypothetical protein